MKNSLFIIILTILMSCQEKNTSNSSQKNGNPPPVVSFFWNSNSDYQEEQVSNFTIDTLPVYDSSRNLRTTLHLPVTNNKVIDKKILSKLNQQKKAFTENLDDMLSKDSLVAKTWESGFNAELVSYYKDNTLISALFRIVYFHAGAAHPMTQYQSFNYNVKTMKEISFEDYFLVKDKLDTMQITQLITENINRDGISLSSLKNIDFNVENNTISFNFDTYELVVYAEGTIRTKVKKKLLQKFIRKSYY